MKVVKYVLAVLAVFAVFAAGTMIGNWREPLTVTLHDVDTLKLVQVDTVVELVPIAPETVVVESTRIKIDTVFQFDTLTQTAPFPECIVALDYLAGHLTFTSLTAQDSGYGYLTQYDYGYGLSDFKVRAKGRGFFRDSSAKTATETVGHGCNSDLYTLGWLYCHSPDYLQTIGGAGGLPSENQSIDSGDGIKTLLT